MFVTFEFKSFSAVKVQSSLAKCLEKNNLRHLFLIKIISLQVIIYCDLHGHSRKPNVFMYGCTADPKMASMSNFVEERLFPWMMSQKVKDRSAVRACKFTATGFKHLLVCMNVYRQCSRTRLLNLKYGDRGFA